MLKQIVPVLCLAALSSACSGSGSGSSSTSGSGTGSTGGTSSGSTSGSSSGGSSGSCVASANIAAVRALPNYGPACVSGVTVVLDSPFGNAVDGGTTQYAGNWFVADSTGAVMSVYHAKKYRALDADPARGDLVNITNGKIDIYPGTDAGAGLPLAGEDQIAGDNLQIESVTVGGGTQPTPTAAAFSDLAAQASNASDIGKWVTVPAGAYTQNSQDPVFKFVSGSSTYYDGLSLTDTMGNVVYIDTYTFSHSTSNCLPTDGGQPDLSAGGFNAAFDSEQTEDSNVHNVLFYGSCGQ